MANGYSQLSNELVSAANGVDYAYRDTGGESGPPLVLLQHFRGNLDNWDPALIDALASARRVVTFDNAGVGRSTGTTPDTIEQMARDALAFMAGMQFSRADLLGFSIGSFVAQQIALARPAIARRLALASSAPQGAAGMHGWAPEVTGAIGTPQTSPEAYLDVFFTKSASSRRAGQQALQRMYARTEDRDTATTWATREWGRLPRPTAAASPGMHRCAAHLRAARASTVPGGAIRWTQAASGRHHAIRGVTCSRSHGPAAPGRRPAMPGVERDGSGQPGLSGRPAGGAASAPPADP
jgi:pimeloyl-ACP methyl ester carboxylesterase